MAEQIALYEQLNAAGKEPASAPAGDLSAGTEMPCPFNLENPANSLK
jgi:hypothetical protein